MQPDPAQTPPRLKTRRRVTVQEAARLLDTSVEGVRSRIKRGTLAKEKDTDGTVYVLLDLDQASPGGAQPSPVGDQTSARATDRAAIDARTNELIEELRAQNEHLRNELAVRNDELRRKDTILMTMAQRIPELEPAREPASKPRESRVPHSDESAGAQEPREHAEPERRSWWKKLFGT